MIIVGAVIVTGVRFSLKRYPPIEQVNLWIKKQFPYPITIQDATLSWKGVTPLVTLASVDMTNEEGISHHCDEIQLRIALWPLIKRQLHLKSLTLQGAELEITESEQGKFHVTDFPKFAWDSSMDNPLNASKVRLKSWQILESDIALTRYNGNKISGEIEYINGNMQTSHFGFSTGHANFNVKAVTIWDMQAAQEHLVGVVSGGASLKKTPKVLEIRGTDIQMGQVPEGTAAQKQWNFEADLYSDQPHLNFVSNHFDLESWPALLVRLGVIPSTWEAAIESAALQGDVTYIHVAADKAGHAWKPTTIDVVFDNISYGSPETAIRLSPLSGALSFDGHQGKLLIHSRELTFDFPKYYQSPMALSEVNFDVKLLKDKEAWTISGKSVHAKYHHTPIGGEFSLSFSENQPWPEVDISMQLGEIGSREALPLLPDAKFPPALMTWLDRAVQAGKLRSTAFVLKGPLQDFPFDKQTGVFKVKCELADVTLDYDERWPKLEHIKADLHFNNRSLKIDGDKATIRGAVVEDIDAIIPNLSATVPMLTVDTQIRGSIVKGQDIIMHSPLKSNLGAALAPFPMKGQIDLSLGLEIPISKSAESNIQVRGLVGLHDAQMDLPDWDLCLDTLSGEIQFSDQHIQAPRLKGRLLGSDALFSVVGDFKAEDAYLKIGCQGRIDEQQLEAWKMYPELPFVQGETSYQATLNISPKQNEQYHFSCISDLKGIEVDAPMPLGKAPHDFKPFKLDIYVEPRNMVRSFTQYGDVLSAAVSTQRHEGTKMLGGHLHIGEKQLAKFREDGIFLVDGEVEQVDFNSWKQFLSRCHIPSKSAEGSDYGVDPLLALEIDTLVFQGLPIKHATLEAELQKESNLWNIHLVGSGVSGMIFYSPDKDKDLQINLQKLILTKEDTEHLTALSSDGSSTLDRPLDLTIAEGSINEIPLSQVSLRMHASGTGYVFDKLALTIPGADLRMTGQWDHFKGPDFVQLKGNIKLRNTTEVFKTLDKPTSIKQAKGSINFNLDWQGKPYKPDLPTLSGILDLRLEKGAIQGVNPGLGRILNLVNLDNVKRRLNLDFSDVTQNGFIFNDLTGRLEFGKGKVSSNDIVINAPSAKIIGFGQADLLTQGIHGEMTVMPHLTATLPMAAAIAVGNPAVGAAVWIVDKMVGDKIQEIHRFRYRLAGSWQSPQVDELEFSLNPYTLLE